MAKLSSLGERSFQTGSCVNVHNFKKIYVIYKTIYVLKSKAGGQLQCKHRFNGDLHEHMEIRQHLL